MFRTSFPKVLTLAVLVMSLVPAAAAAEPAAGGSVTRQIVIYGGTSGGLVAGIAARKLGKSVIVIEPTRHVGGLTSGGLGATDIGNKAAIGGLAREFYQRIGRHYAADTAWKHERRDAYESKRKAPDEREMWTFEPHVAERVYREWLAEAGVEVLTGERLDLGAGGVEKAGGRIVAIRMESGRRFAGAVRRNSKDWVPRWGLGRWVGVHLLTVPANPRLKSKKSVKSRWLVATASDQGGNFLQFLQKFVN